MTDHRIVVPGLPRWHPDPRVRDTIDRIRRFGWVVNSVTDICEDCRAAGATPEITLTYTVGLALRGTPELAVYGLDSTRGYAVLQEIVDLLAVEDWTPIVDSGLELTVDALDVPVRVIEMIDTLDLVDARSLFPDVPALQVVWADEHGRYPWEDTYLLPSDAQRVHGIPDATAPTRPVGPRVIRSADGPNRAHRRARNRRRR